MNELSSHYSEEFVTLSDAEKHQLRALYRRSNGLGILQLTAHVSLIALALWLVHTSVATPWYLPSAFILGAICAGAGVFIHVRADRVAALTDAADGGTHRAWIGHIFVAGGLIFALINLFGAIQGTREKPIEGLVVAVVFFMIGLAMVLMRRGKPPEI